MHRWLSLFLTVLLFVGVPAHAAPEPDSCDTCMTEERREAFGRFQRRLADAESVDEARAMADRRLGQADAALSRAEALVPDDPGLADGRAELDALGVAVDAAESPTEIATAFGSFDAEAAGGCDYTTGEIIAIVLGFIFGIIPGIILLILLC